jgi:glycine oxidase
MHTGFAIVGGGVNGLMTALALSEHSNDITVIDAQTTGQGCSWAGGGILSALVPWHEHPANQALCQQGQKMYPQLCAQLRDETGIDPEYTQEGMLILDCAETDSIAAWCEANGVNAGIIGHDREDLFPGVRLPDGASSVWLPDVAHVRNPRLLRALKAALQKRGVQILEHHRVEALEYYDHRVHCRMDTGNLEAEKAILCNGVWINELLPESAHLPMRPMRGQMLCLEDHGFELQSIILNRDCYVIPRRGGVLLIGSTVEDAGFDSGITDTARRQLLASAEAMIPGLGNQANVRQWSGLRPDSMRGYPYIGAISGFDSLYVNAGHFRTGLLAAPASAALLTALLSGSEPVLNSAVYEP